MAEKEEQEPPSKLKPSTGVSRPTISLPPRPFGEMFFSGGVGFSPGPMTLVSNLFSDPDEFKSFSQLLAGAMASPAVAAAAVVATAHHQTPVSSVGDGGGSGDVDPRFKQNRPTGLMITQPPAMFTVPPGLSPATLLDSPSFFGLFSPLQGAFGMTHQQALAQVTAQAVQGNNVHMQSQSEYPSSTQQQQQQQQQQQASLTQLPSFSSGTRSQIPAPVVQDSLQGQRETSEIVSVYEHRSQPQNADKPADDGYNWRKYGQKQVKGSDFPRSYYKCTHQACPVKKKVERSLDGQVTEIIYKGQHNHEPPQKRGYNNGNSKSSDIGTQFQNSNNSLNKNKRDQETSQVTTTEQMSEASDSEDGNAETSVGDKREDEPDPKRRTTQVQVSEPVASSHKTVTEPRIIVQTTSEVDLLDDGYRWRKYGQKVVKGNPYPRSYYKCTTPACGVRKHVERAANDPKAVVTTYEGKHNHDVPAARTSSHQLRPNNQHNTSTVNFNQQQPVARLRLKEEQIT